MTARRDRRDETAAAWVANAIRSRYGFCEECGLDRDVETGKRHIVARRVRGDRFLCFGCAHREQAQTRLAA